jgi:hypothetical protein
MPAELTSPPNVHPTRLSEWGLWVMKQAIQRTGQGDHARRLIARASRLTYGRHVAAIPNREELPFVLNARKLFGCGAEIGVARGLFSEHLLIHWRGDRLISIDPWLEAPAGEYVDVCSTSQENLDKSYWEARERLARFGERSTIWRKTGDEAAELISPQSLDFVYIDARHDYDSVKNDLERWFPLVRPGGLIAGHDYNEGTFAEGIHGVRPAVDEFFQMQKLRVRHTFTDVPCTSWIVAIPS